MGDQPDMSHPGASLARDAGTPGAGTGPSRPVQPRREGLDIAVHRARGGVTMVQVRGDAHTGALDDLARGLDDALRGSPATPRIVLDLAGITSLCPEAVDVLVRAEEEVAAAEGVIELLAPSPSVLLLLHDTASGESGVSARSSRRPGTATTR